MKSSNSKVTTPLRFIFLGILMIMVAFVGFSEEIPVNFSEKNLVDQGWFVSMNPSDFPITNEGKIPAMNIGLIHRKTGSRIFVLATTSQTPLYLDAIDRQPPAVLLKHLRLEKKYSSGHLDRGVLSKFGLDAIQWKIEGPGDGISFLPQGKRKVRTLGLRTVISLAAIGPDGQRVNVLLTGFFRGASSGTSKLQAEFTEFLKTLRPKDQWSIMPHDQVAEIENREDDFHVFEVAPTVIKEVIARIDKGKPIVLSKEERDVLEGIHELAPNDPAATLLLLADKGGEKPVFIGSEPRTQYRKYTDNIIEIWNDDFASRIMAMAYGKPETAPASHTRHLTSENHQICAVTQRIEFTSGSSTYVFACQEANPNEGPVAVEGTEYRFSEQLGWVPPSPAIGTKNTRLQGNEAEQSVFIASGDARSWVYLGQPLASIPQKESYFDQIKKACSGKPVVRWSEDLERGVFQTSEWRGKRFLMEGKDQPILMENGLKKIFGEKGIRKTLKKDGPAYPICLQE